MLEKSLLKFNKRDFLNTNLYNSIEEECFYNDKLAIEKNAKKSILHYFESEEKLFDDPYKYHFEIERIYIDFYTLEIRSAVVSFSDKYRYTSYLLLVRNILRNTYDIKFISEDMLSVDTKESEEKSFSSELCSKILMKLKDIHFNNLHPFNSCLYYALDSQSLTYSYSLLDEESKKLFEILIKRRMKLDTLDGVEIISFNVDVSDIFNPFIISIYFTLNGKNKLYWLIDENGSVDNKDLSGGLKDSTYYDFVFTNFQTSFKKHYQYLFIEENKEKNIEEVEKIIRNIYKKFTIYKRKDDDGVPCLYFQELGDSNFIFFEKDSLLIYESRNVNIEDVYELSYEKIIENNDLVKKAIDNYLSTNPVEYDEYIQKVHEILEDNKDIDAQQKKCEQALKDTNKLAKYDKDKQEIKDLSNKLNDRIEKIKNINKYSISTVLGLFKKIVDVETYNKYSDELYDIIDELSDLEIASIQKEYNEFLDKFGDVPQYLSEQTVYRRVFIRKSALEDLKKIDLEQKDLKLLKVTDDIVDKLKTLPGNQLGRYLLEKGLNFPINNDRSIKKIRILRKAKYRLLFVYGSDLDIDRINNEDSIYIFAVTEHKKEKSELYRLASSKPDKYRINDFIIYPKNKIVKIPECTSEQYNVASNFDNQPVVTFGCAGSGKTTVSIEQYVNIVYNRYNCQSPTPDKLVYITFHKGLSEKVKKDLSEYKISANSYKLDEYFAYVLNKEFDQDKIINEAKFIAWYDAYFSSSELKSNKYQKKKKLNPLKDKPDVARLLYTYYRGVFKGSRELLNISEDHLSLDLFMQMMKDEEYLLNEEKEAIYQICLDFNDYAIENGLMSDNDLAIEVVRSQNLKIKKSECIIVDEVQDLTEIEVIACILTLKDDSNRIYFYGDPHQSINPNLFDGNTINRIYSELHKDGSSETSPLTITYRTNKHLIRYLNELLKYRDKWIGLAKGGQASIGEPPITDDENSSWAGYVTNPALYNRIFESSPTSMIITPSDSVKASLLNKYPNIDKERVITIYEAKGMEWDTIIMYDMFTSYENYFLDMISENGKAKKSTIHRMTFNKYYVGCTRSTKSFVIIEDNSKIFSSEHPIFKTLLTSFAPIYKEEQISTYVLEDNTFDGWYKEALQNLTNENTSTFEYALQHASRLAKTKEEKALLGNLMSNDPKALEGLAEKCLKDKDYDLAAGAFTKLYRITKKYGPYITLCVLLTGRRAVKDEHLRELLKHPDIIEKYPEVLKSIVKHAYFKKKLKEIHTRLYKKKEN